MKLLSITTQPIPDIKVVRFGRFKDPRGYFCETFRRSDLDSVSSLETFVPAALYQCNESYSKRGVIRGLHFQWQPAMGKLVRTIFGRMLDLVLDIRLGSPTFGRALAYDMPARVDSTENEWIWVPPGFAHGNCFLEPTMIEYFCTAEYAPGNEGCISPLSSDIDWTLSDSSNCALLETMFKKNPIITDKDRSGSTVEEWLNSKSAHYFSLL